MAVPCEGAAAYCFYDLCAISQRLTPILPRLIFLLIKGMSASLPSHSIDSGTLKKTFSCSTNYYSSSSAEIPHDPAGNNWLPARVNETQSTGINARCQNSAQ